MSATATQASPKGKEAADPLALLAADVKALGELLTADVKALGEAVQELRAAPSPSALADQEKYLRSRGWKQLPEGERPNDKCWLDPTKPYPRDEERKVKIAERKQPDGSSKDVFQTYVQPAAWPLTLKDAVAIQRERDREAAKKR